MKLNEKGLLIVISGPSGVGKGTIRKALFNRPGHNLDFSVSMTTRSPRVGEVDGKDYYFVSKEKFEEELAKGNLLEHAKFVNNYYGTPKDKVIEKLEEGKEVVLEISIAFRYSFNASPVSFAKYKIMAPFCLYPFSPPNDMVNES